MTDQFSQFSPKDSYSQSGSNYSGSNWRAQQLPSEAVKNSDELEYKLHPKECRFPLINKHFTVQINTKVELEFLSNVEQNTPFDYKKFGLSIPRQLMTLLNQYNIGDGWSCNPQRGNSVAAFSLLYFGVGSLTPTQYQLNRKAPLVAIVEVDTFNGKEVLSIAVR